MPEAAALSTGFGEIVQGDCLPHLRAVPDESVDLIMTSPPYALQSKKAYGNVPPGEYVEWFLPFAREFYRVIKPSGSVVINIGGTWNRSEPTRNLYQWRLLLSLCDDVGFHLAQDFYWWNMGMIPTPAIWVTVRRVRVKTAVEFIWWLSKTPWPKASNRRILKQYSEAMARFIAAGGQPGDTTKPSGYHIKDGAFGRDNGGAIPPNLLAISHSESNTDFLRRARARGEHHPARFPERVPEFFVRMLTDAGDHVIDPFAGSCTTGIVCERLHRRWTCIEIRGDYCDLARERFTAIQGVLDVEDPLPLDGGRDGEHTNL